MGRGFFCPAVGQSEPFHAASLCFQSVALLPCHSFQNIGVEDALLSINLRLRLNKDKMSSSLFFSSTESPKVTKAFLFIQSKHSKIFLNNMQSK